VPPGDLPWHLPEDLRHFKRLTRGGVLVMGRRTWQSLGERPLPDRTIVVLSRQDLTVPAGVRVLPSLETACRAFAGAGRLWIAGGEAVYREALPLASGLELTRIDLAPDGDARFPDFDPSEWHLVEERVHPADGRHACELRFQRWLRSPDPTGAQPGKTFED
jgi:dihydrofolate reductase